MGQNMGQEVLCRNTKIISKLFEQKAKEKVLKSVDFRTIYGCGGRTRTYDLRVMSSQPAKTTANYGKIREITLKKLGKYTPVLLCHIIAQSVIMWRVMVVSQKLARDWEVNRHTLPGDVYTLFTNIRLTLVMMSVIMVAVRERNTLSHLAQN